ncbi:MAG TPA: universal stress protein [Acidimicrobiia bacterium]
MRRRVVVGVDASPASARALCWAYGEACREGATLEVVTAYRLLPMISPVDGCSLALDAAESRRSAECVQHEVLRDELGRDAADPRIERVVAAGLPWTVLVQRARTAALLVVGRRSSRMRRLLTGSTSKRCANRASCPVVIVRGPKHGGREPVLVGDASVPRTTLHR